MRPNLFVDFETEFWPNFFRGLKEENIPALLLNGRISESSERLYRYLSPLFRPVFDHFDHMAMHSAEDMERAIRVGARPEKVEVLGSSKYDGLIDRARPERAQFWKDLLGIGDEVRVMVGGSLRGSECFSLMRVFKELRMSWPATVAVFAPRHMYNIPRMCGWLAKENIGYDLLTSIEKGEKRRTAPVVLIDRMGALFDIYSIGDLIFCGGTLEPVGGHNILEPAAWSKPVFYGPCLKKVLHEHRILRAFDASFPVLDSTDLLSQWERWVKDPDGLAAHGENARKALRSLRGVVDRQIDLIVELLSKKAD